MTSSQGIAYDINTAPEHIFLKAEDMMATFKIGKTSLWNWVKQKKIPLPYDYTGRATHWTIGQIRNWQSARALAITAKRKKEMIKECASNLDCRSPRRNQLRSEFDQI